MQDPKFIHLRVHSDYSMVDGLAKTKPIVGKIAELNMPAFAIIIKYVGLLGYARICEYIAIYGPARRHISDTKSF